MQKSERRQELLHAARDLFATKGFHDTKVDDIVAAANVAKGTFYLYFRDKRSVFSELVDGFFVRLGGAILKVEPSADVESQIKHNIRAIVAVLLDDRALTHILLSSAVGLDAAFVKKIESFYAGVKKLLAGSLKEGQSLGIVAAGDTNLFATFTIGALKEVLAQNARGDAPAHREDIVAGLFAFLESGYLRMTPASVDATPALPETPKRSAQARRSKP